VLSQYFDDFFCVANWKTAAHGTASSNSFAPFASFMGAGSNHKARASLAFSIASASVSPAVAQPGNSGKTADHRLISGSNSSRRRNFIFDKLTARFLAGKQGSPRTAARGRPGGKKGTRGDRGC